MYNILGNYINCLMLSFEELDLNDAYIRVIFIVTWVESDDSSVNHGKALCR